MSFKNTWRYGSTNCTLRYRRIDWKLRLQEFGWYIFNGKLYIKSFICEYPWIYDTKYPPLAAEKDG